MTVASRGRPGRGSGIGFAPFFYAASQQQNIVALWICGRGRFPSTHPERPFGRGGVVNVRLIVHTPRHQGTRAPGCPGTRPRSPASRPSFPAGMRHHAVIPPRSPLPAAFLPARTWGRASLQGHSRKPIAGFRGDLSIELDKTALRLTNGWGLACHPDKFQASSPQSPVSPARPLC